MAGSFCNRDFNILGSVKLTKMAGWPDDCEGVLKVKFISAHLKLKLGLNVKTSYMFRMSLATSYI